MPSEDKARAALAAHPFPQNPWVLVTAEGIVIKCGFSEQLLQLLRWVPKVQWRPEKRHWTVPFAGAEAVRGVLPEILRLAELTQPQARNDSPAAEEGDLSAPDRFKKAARLLFGGDWQRDTANALERDETALVRWLLGESQLEDPEKLLDAMLVLMRRRAVEITAEADRLAAAIAKQRQTAVDP
jgi:hypothetical protein